MNNTQTVSREEYRRLDNRVTCILQQRWPANEIRQWVGMLKGKQQDVACAILRRRHPRPSLLALPAIAAEVPISLPITCADESMRGSASPARSAAG